MFDLSTISSADLEPYLGQTISLRFHQGPVLEAVLKSLTEKPLATIPGSPRTAFTAILSTPLPCDVLAGNADLVHPEFGTLTGLLLERTTPDSLQTTDALFKLVFN